MENSITAEQEIITTTSTNVPAKATRKEWLGLIAIALPCLVYSMDLTVLNLAIPNLSADLKPSSTQLLWIIDIYGFLVAGFLITMGTLGDRIGRRKLLMYGAAFFGIASILAAFTTSAGMLIAARAILGISGATVAPSTLSLIRNMFHDEKQRTTAIGVWIASYSAGGVIGPLIGGVMLEYFWWGSVFLVAVPVMALLLIVAPILLPEYKDANAGKLDFLSAILSLISVLSVIFGLKQMAENGIGWLSISSVVLGIVLGIIFIQRQKKLTHPLIDINLFKRASFSTPLTIYTLTCFVMFGCFVFTFQYLQLVLGYSPFTAGLWSLPSFAGFILGSMLVPTLVQKFRKGYVMAIGLLFAATGFLLLAQVTSTTGIGYMVAANIIFSLGLSPTFTLTTDLIIGAAPPERAGAASAISETGAEFGGALGIALLGSVGAVMYQTTMAKSIPANIPEQAAEAAKSTLGGAVAEAASLPADVSANLLTIAREAFVESFQVTAITGGVVVVILAVLAAVKLRNLKQNAEPQLASH